MTVRAESTECYVKARGDAPQRPDCFECNEGVLVFEALYPDRHGDRWTGAAITCTECDNDYYDSVLPKHIGTTIRVRIQK